MKIDRIKYEEAYRCGRQVHAGKMRITDAKRQLAEIGINPNSSVDLVYGLGHMLDGHRYTRTMSAELVGDYLLWIERDYGRKYLKNAVSALEQHIEYYQSLTKSPMRSHVELLNKYSALLQEDVEEFLSPEEITEPADLVEGKSKTISVNVYERNPKARRKCIDHFGCMCSVCGFDFEKSFGAIGKGFIHVHHLLDLATIRKSYTVNPLEDLRPVCPNCHAMLHKSKPAYSIEELKKLMAAQ
jgi:5-methylcytosine-specific restriction protein A